MLQLTRDLFSRYFFSQRAGSVIRVMARICCTATLVGVASLIFVQSVMNGFNRSIRRKLLVAEPHVRVYGDLHAEDFSDLPFKVESAREFVEQDVILRTLDGRFSGGVARAYPKAELTDYIAKLYRQRFRLNEDAALKNEAITLDVKDIAVGVDLARELGLFEGDEVVLYAPETLLLPAGEAPPFERVRVQQLIASDIPDIDSKLILFLKGPVPLRFQTARSSTSGVEFRLTDADQADAFKRAVLASPRENVTEVETWGDRNEALFFALRMEKFAMTLFLYLAVIITCFSLITVLIMLISQKQREIGLLMAIGLSLKQARRLFLAIGSSLSGLGVVLGLAIGIAASLILQAYPLEILPDIYYDRSLPSQVDWRVIGYSAAGLIAMAFLFAYWPVKLYVKNMPAANLRSFRDQTDT